MTFRRRALIALFLLLTMPLRVFAAGAMPCCPMPAPMHHAMSMSIDTHDMPTSDMPADHAHHADQSTCCSIALMSSPAIDLPLRPDMPAAQRDEHIESFAAFLTDAPERPPRLPILSA